MRVISFELTHCWAKKKKKILNFSPVGRMRLIFRIMNSLDVHYSILNKDENLGASFIFVFTWKYTRPSISWNFYYRPLYSWSILIGIIQNTDTILFLSIQNWFTKLVRRISKHLQDIDIYKNLIIRSII